jgi:hypothetical protein
LVGSLSGESFAVAQEYEAMNTGVLNSNTSSWSFVVLKSNHFVLRDPSVALDGSSELGLSAPGHMTDAGVMAVPELSLKLNSATWVMVLAVLVWSRVNLMNLIPASAYKYLPAGQSELGSLLLV